MKGVTVKRLYGIHVEHLGLSWVAGERGADREITIDPDSTDGVRGGGGDNRPLPSKSSGVTAQSSSSSSLVGHLNLIHPHQIQVLGHIEIEYLATLREISRQDAIRQILAHQPACIIVAENQSIPAALKRSSEARSIPLLKSSLSSNKLTDDLHFYLSTMLAQAVTLHGVYLEVITIGLLLTGKSGLGKSELALELITRGHRLVADDAPEFRLVAPDTIKGSAPLGLANFIEVRGLGIINVRELFGASAVTKEKFLRLIIHLERLESDRVVNLDRLAGSYRTRDVLGVEVPEITLPVAPGRNLAVLVECATRNHILRMGGYNAAEDFMAQRLVDQEAMS